ncbi:hypothetical protein [Pendulispora albinea]|uniref:SnoaL-like domain-containing protein n=1 Tax=Pendulispora albinea TaxID=2741071 RepID=A0ABZ2M2K5_9BACT
MESSWSQDVQQIETIVKAVYACISAPAGVPRDWARFRYLHHPRALSLRTVVDAEGHVEAQIFSVEEYIANVEVLLTNMDFHEIEVARRVERFGEIAHVWSVYEARATPESPTLIKRGANSIQLSYDGTRWWVVSTTWVDERPGLVFDLF